MSDLSVALFLSALVFAMATCHSVDQWRAVEEMKVKTWKEAR